MPLTVVIPTRNRPRHCAALVHFLRRCGIGWDILVADSSDDADAEATRVACGNTVDYVRFPASIAFMDKLAAIMEQVHTPFTALLADDDVTLPHAIEQCLAYMLAHDDFAAAHGYFLDFGTPKGLVDITGVRWFTPGVEQAQPLERMYRLMSRYQSVTWAVIRTPAAKAAIELSRRQQPIVFQEFAFANALVLQGKLTRLPIVYTMRGPEESLSPLDEVHPLFALLKDAALFFDQYARYRNDLIEFAMTHVKPAPDRGSLTQLFDVIHATRLVSELDPGRLNHEAQRLLGYPLSPIAEPPAWRGWRELSEEDETHSSTREGRRYIWRHEVMEAEPKAEIRISGEEMAAVDRQLDFYDLPSAAVAG